LTRLPVLLRLVRQVRSYGRVFDLLVDLRSKASIHAQVKWPDIGNSIRPPKVRSMSHVISLRCGNSMRFWAEADIGQEARFPVAWASTTRRADIT
jgi:hypothetical protein